jgi:VanZ family protein
MKKEVFWWILAILICFIIFNFTASSSSTGSNTQHIIGKITGLDDKHAATLNFVIRKTTHLTIFGLLGICFYMALRKRKFLIAWGLTTLYAASDEYHQSFMPGRTAAVKDVILDSCGSIVAILIVRFFVQKRYSKSK